MNCENCFHYDICIFHLTGEEYKNCPHFKDELMVLVFPCKVGDYIEWKDDSVGTVYLEVRGFHYDPKDFGLRAICRDFSPVLSVSNVKRFLTEQEIEELKKKEREK